MMTFATLAQAAAPDGDWLIWGFILLGIALVLLFLELFVPSGGVLGILCGIAAIASVIAFFRHDTVVGAVALSAYIILTPILLVFLFKVWIHSPLGRRMILGADQDLDDGETDPRHAGERARQDRLARLRQLIGAEGITATTLRPVGFVKIGAERLDAMAEHGVIAENTPVIVVDVYDNQIKVRPR